MASLFTAGDEQEIARVYRKMLALRVFKRAQTVGDIPDADVTRALADGDTTPAELEAIYHLTSIADYDERFVIPPFAREAAIELLESTQEQQEGGGMGFIRAPRRGL
jgi:nitrate reductase beta subunit